MLALDARREACETLEKKGGAHPHERSQAKLTPGY
jgi:hypothetical protein